jgi:hypothetical protein
MLLNLLLPTAMITWLKCDPKIRTLLTTAKPLLARFSCEYDIAYFQQSNHADPGHITKFRDDRVF